MATLKARYVRDMRQYVEALDPHEVQVYLGFMTKIAYDFDLDTGAALAAMIAARQRNCYALDPLELRTLSRFFEAMFEIGAGARG